jgi:hypothetical protein
LAKPIFEYFAVFPEFSQSIIIDGFSIDAF